MLSISNILKKVVEKMARKKKTQEVSIVETSKDSDVITDLQVLVGDEVIGEIHQGEDDRHFQVLNIQKKKGTALSIEDAVEAIIADYNLHK